MRHQQPLDLLRAHLDEEHRRPVPDTFGREQLVRTHFFEHLYSSGPGGTYDHPLPQAHPVPYRLTEQGRRAAAGADA